MTAEPVIEVRDLRKWYPLRSGFLASLLGRQQGQLKAVDGVSFALRPGEVLGLAGESGCGKSTTGMTVLQLHRPTGGEILFQGHDVATRGDARSMKAFRRQAQIVFQNPYESLNPRFTVAQSVREPIAIHFREEAGARRDRLLLAMERAGLMPVENYLDRYPHQLSGGQLQRIAIARAISVEPRFLVADEPVSMLDVSIRAGILNLLRRFAGTLDMAILYISHDLSTMRHVCSQVAIMYLGRIVEIGPAASVLRDPQHPYAQALMAAVPVMGVRRRKRIQLSGAVPNAADVPRGCRFHPRCPQAMASCREVEPQLKDLGQGRRVACHLH
ncbi:MAG: ABC transporter ATP-binding protein [Alphaproteobacteria bacterium]|nr:ABC transporter ATP-binding protein [Alphaproteobacteria bacterium]